MRQSEDSKPKKEGNSPEACHTPSESSFRRDQLVDFLVEVSIYLSRHQSSKKNHTKT